MADLIDKPYYKIDTSNVHFWLKIDEKNHLCAVTQLALEDVFQVFPRWEDGFLRHEEIIVALAEKHIRNGARASVGVPDIVLKRDHFQRPEIRR
jgi:hypothetical protein